VHEHRTRPSFGSSPDRRSKDPQFLDPTGDTW
jgi:hypothetical protein